VFDRARSREQLVLLLVSRHRVQRRLYLNLVRLRDVDVAAASRVTQLLKRVRPPHDLLHLRSRWRLVLHRGRLVHLCDKVAQIVVVVVLQRLVHRRCLALQFDRFVLARTLVIFLGVDRPRLLRLISIQGVHAAFKSRMHHSRSDARRAISGPQNVSRPCAGRSDGLYCGRHRLQLARLDGLHHALERSCLRQWEHLTGHWQLGHAVFDWTFGLCLAQHFAHHFGLEFRLSLLAGCPLHLELHLPVKLFLFLACLLFSEFLQHQLLLAIFEGFPSVRLPFVFGQGGRFCGAVLLAFVKHGAVSFVFFPLAAEHFDKGSLLVETRVFLKDGLVRVLAQPHESAALGSRIGSSLVVGNVLSSVVLALKNVQNAVFMLPKFFDVDVGELTADEIFSDAFRRVLPLLLLFGLPYTSQQSQSGFQLFPLLLIALLL